MTITTTLHQQYERTYCDCRQCVAACRAMPGMLVPGDIERLAEYLCVDPDDEQFWRDHLRASDGCRAIHAGQVITIPTIVPAQQDDTLRCVFLDDDDRCIVHQVAPFGCSRFRVCTADSEDDRRSEAALFKILHDADYNLVWAWLWSHGLRAPSLHDRKARLQKLIDDSYAMCPACGKTQMDIETGVCRCGWRL